MDFINPVKFYDRYATRDLEGFEMGFPFFPWFADVGRAEIRRDVLGEKDAVRVRYCWGGMTAFDASLFQEQELGREDNVGKGNVGGIELLPLRFGTS